MTVVSNLRQADAIEINADMLAAGVEALCEMQFGSAPTEMGRTAALQAARAAHEYAYCSDDAQEGPRAFSEKRAPIWKGK
jgi:1,4-dihydroxy-2-naphthoyl-CoA synthase